MLLLFITIAITIKRVIMAIVTLIPIIPPVDNEPELLRAIPSPTKDEGKGQGESL